MPNYCDYSMKIVGSRNNCERFLEKLKKYETKNHFYRIFEAYVVEEEKRESDFSMIIDGYCAWSLESCCRSGYTNGVDLFEINSRDLRLKLEAYSREPGMGFEEHYLYDNGECIEDECRDIETYYWDRSEFPTYEEFKSEYNSAPPESLFADSDEVCVGGFEDDYGYWSI